MVDKNIINEIKIDLYNWYALERMEKVFYYILINFINDEDNNKYNEISVSKFPIRKFKLGKGSKYLFYVEKFENKIKYVYTLNAREITSNENYLDIMKDIDSDEKLVEIEVYKDGEGYSRDSYIGDINEKYKDICTDSYNLKYCKEVKDV